MRLRIDVAKEQFDTLAKKKRMPTQLLNIDNVDFVGPDGKFLSFSLDSIARVGTESSKKLFERIDKMEKELDKKGNPKKFKNLLPYERNKPIFRLRTTIRSDSIELPKRVQLDDGRVGMAMTQQRGSNGRTELKVIFGTKAEFVSIDKIKPWNEEYKDFIWAGPKRLPKPVDPNKPKKFFGGRKKKAETAAPAAPTA